MQVTCWYSRLTDTKKAEIMSLIPDPTTKLSTDTTNAANTIMLVPLITLEKFPSSIVEKYIGNIVEKVGKSNCHSFVQFHIIH